MKDEPSLPPMPDPKWIYHASNVEGEDDLWLFSESGAVNEGCANCEQLFTADQLRAYALLAVAQEREKAQPLLEALQTIAAQSSGRVGSTDRADCMAAIAAAAIRSQP